MRFIGIDLAWSEKNGSGFAVIEGDRKSGRVMNASVLGADVEILKNVRENAGAKSFVAIDAPLIVPNREGRRPADSIVSDLFRKYNAGAYPANRTRLSSWSGKIRGEEISRQLERTGFEHSPYIKRFEERNKFFEVYPHPSMVVIFDLDKVIPYKSKPKRDYEMRWKAFGRYQKCLEGLEKASPSLTIPKELLHLNLRGLRGGGLKDYEDKLDAIFCAYVAYYCWTDPKRCAVLGDMKKGYILTAMNDKIRNKQNKL